MKYTTLGKTGLKVSKCSVCGDKKEQVIPVIATIPTKEYFTNSLANSPNTLAILAIDSPYCLVLVTGSVKLTLEINAKFVLLLLISFKA